MKNNSLDMTNQLITIIVPIYKAEAYLKAAIESILAQSYTNFELILVIDGSPDECSKICENYSDTDKRIIVIHKENGGTSSARNIGIDIATGDYISFIDSDDYVEYNLLEILYRNAKETNADISICTKFLVTQKNTRKYNAHYEKSVMSGEEATKELLLFNKYDFGVHDKLFKKEMFNNIRFENGRIYEDYYPMTQLFCKANIVVFESIALYHYIKRDESITTSAFSLKSMDLAHASAMVLKVIRDKNRDLYPIAKRLDYLKNIGLAYRIMNSGSSEFTEEYKIVKNNVIHYFKEALTNKYLTTIERIALVVFTISPRFYKIIRARK